MSADSQCLLLQPLSLIYELHLMCQPGLCHPTQETGSGWPFPVSLFTSPYPVCLALILFKVQTHLDLLASQAGDGLVNCLFLLHLVTYMDTSTHIHIYICIYTYSYVYHYIYTYTCMHIYWTLYYHAKGLLCHSCVDYFFVITPRSTLTWSDSTC